MINKLNILAIVLTIISSVCFSQIEESMKNSPNIITFNSYNVDGDYISALKRDKKMKRKKSHIKFASKSNYTNFRYTTNVYLAKPINVPVKFKYTTSEKPPVIAKYRLIENSIPNYLYTDLKETSFKNLTSSNKLKNVPTVKVSVKEGIIRNNMWLTYIPSLVYYTIVGLPVGYAVAKYTIEFEVLDHNGISVFKKEYSEKDTRYISLYNIRRSSIALPYPKKRIQIEDPFEVVIHSIMDHFKTDFSALNLTLEGGMTLPEYEANTIPHQKRNKRGTAINQATFVPKNSNVVSEETTMFSEYTTKQLETMIEDAVKTENFKKAEQLNTEIENRKAAIQSLQKKIDEALAIEDYKTAATLQGQIDKLAK